MRSVENGNESSEDVDDFNVDETSKEKKLSAFN